MLRKHRHYFYTVWAAAVLVSLLVTSGAKACEDAPQTLLSLYMNSDFVVLAKYESDGESKKSHEDEYGFTTDIERNLSLTKIYKGQRDLKTISFVFSEYQPKNADSQNDYETEEIHDSAYFDVSKIKIGGEYLFFLTKDRETGNYTVTDYVSGVREIAGKSAVWENKLKQLEEIASAKENQYDLLTEWIVQNIENPEMREDGIQDLAESFYGLTYQEEDTNFKGKGPFVTVEGYSVYTVGVAKKLTQAQKARISTVLYPMLQEAWFAPEPQYLNYGISAILGGINKSRLALFAYNSLQSVAKTDAGRKRIIMEFLTDFLADETLSKIYYDYSELESKIDEMKNSDSAVARKQLKIMSASKESLLRNFDTRFKFLYGRHFVPVPEKKS